MELPTEIVPECSAELHNVMAGHLEVAGGRFRVERVVARKQRVTGGAGFQWHTGSYPPFFNRPYMLPLSLQAYANKIADVAPSRYVGNWVARFILVSYWHRITPSSPLP